MEDNKLWEEYSKTKDFELRKKIIEKYAVLVKIIAGRLSIYVNSQIEYKDLISYGIFGLMDAIDKFDYVKGFKFETYASLRIRGEIIDNIRKLDWIPRSLRQKNKLLESAISNFEIEYGREPSEEELSEILGITVNEVQILIKNSCIYNLISLDDYLEQNHENFTNISFVESEELPEKSFLEKEKNEMIVEVLQELTEKQRKVIILYYYEELTLKEISKIMNVSESRISQIHSKTIKLLKNKLGKKDIHLSF